MATVTFTFTGSDQFFTVPQGVTSIFVVLLGGSGGAGKGGPAGRTRGWLPVTPGEILTIAVGGQGATPGRGFNGGGAGAGSGGGGGGASDVRRGTTRLAIAGGGGGGGSLQDGFGGQGGGTVGGAGQYDIEQNVVASGGTQTQGGSPNGSQFSGGDALADNSGGGGGGFYGGGGDSFGGGGGAGGSALVPAGGDTTSGLHFGNGSATLTFNDPPTAPGPFTAPAAGVATAGNTTVSWGAATDPDGFVNTYELEISTNGGGSWTVVNSQNNTSRVVNMDNYAVTTQAVLRVRAVDNEGLPGPWTNSSTFIIDRVPATPALGAPAANVFARMADGFTFTFTHNANGGTALARAFLRRTRGGVGTEYWNGSAWVTSEVSFANTSGSVSFPGNSWPPGAYTWAVKTENQAALGSPYTGDRTLTVTAPYGMVT